jgi:elongator complex protein 3
MKKLARTISGITPVAVMSQPMGCPGACVYCPTFRGSPQSYTPESPAVIRGRVCDFDAAAQVRLRLKAFTGMGHSTDKVEIIVMGGTFLSAHPVYQYRFIKDCYDALNGISSTTLEEAKQINETARFRCVGLCVETRPDVCGADEISRLLDFGATRIELGVQTLEDDIFDLVRRGHHVGEVIGATRRLKNCGFKVHYHWMPGLPGMTPQRDLNVTRQLFLDQKFRPDGLKLYPTMVIVGTELEYWYREGRYKPYDDETMIRLLADIKIEVPPYVRISRVLRDVPQQFIVGGLKNSVRDAVKTLLRDRGTPCQCVRCREIGHRRRDGWEIGKPALTRITYLASGGKEVFLEISDEQKTLFGLLRLRIQDTPLLDSEDRSPFAVIRELHVYGTEVPLGRQRNDAAQHYGIGKWLVREAEQIARDEFGATTIFILSGVGARDYYRREFGYELRGGYMVRRL